MRASVTHYSYVGAIIDLGFDKHMAIGAAVMTGAST